MSLQLLKDKVYGIRYISNEISHSLAILEHIEFELYLSIAYNSHSVLKIIYKKLMNDLILNTQKLMKESETHSFKAVLNILHSNFSKVYDVSKINKHYEELRNLYNFFEEDLEMMRNKFIAHLDSNERRSKANLSKMGDVGALFEKVLSFSVFLSQELILQNAPILNEVDKVLLQESLNKVLKVRQPND